MVGIIQIFNEPSRYASPVLARHLADEYVVDFLHRMLIGNRFAPFVSCDELLALDIGPSFPVHKIVVAKGEAAPMSLNELFEQKHWFRGFYEFISHWGIRAVFTDKKRALDRATNTTVVSGVIRFKPTIDTFFKHPRVLKAYLKQLFPMIYFANVPHSKLIIGDCGEVVCNLPSRVFCDDTVPNMEVVRKFFAKYEVNCAFRTRWRRISDGVYSVGFERTPLYGKVRVSTKWRIGSCNYLSDVRYIEPYENRVALHFSGSEPIVLSADEYRINHSNGTLVPCAQLPLRVVERPADYKFVYTTTNDAWTGSFSRFALEFANTLLHDVPTANLKTSYLAPTVALGLLDPRNLYIERVHRAKIECDVHAYGFDTALPEPCAFTTTVLVPFYEQLFKPCDLQALARDYPTLLNKVVAPLLCDDYELVTMLCATLELLVKRYWTVKFVCIETDARDVHQTFFC